MFNYHFLAVRHGTLPRFLGLSFLNGLVTTRLCRRERWAKLGPWPPVAGVLPLLLRLLLGSRAHPGPTCGLAGGLLGAGHPAVHVAPFWSGSGYIFEAGSDFGQIGPSGFCVMAAARSFAPKYICFYF